MHNNNCLGLWKTLGNIICKNKDKHSNINQIKLDNKIVNDPMKITTAFNNYFCNIGKDLASKFDNITDNDHSKFMKEKQNQSMYMHKTNSNEIINLINKLDTKKASGHDEFSAKFLKLCKPYISEQLSEIFNHSITNGVFPDLLKIARVTPIFKKGDKHEISNYRPISVLSLINKLFEKIIHKRLYKYPTKCNIIYQYQFGFREGHSTVQALTEITDRIKNAIDNKMLTCGIMIDLTKAFDTVNHNILLKKLYNYGLRGNVYKLFKSYLTNRKQYVKIKNENSDLKSISCGVPQGSVLGPLLFIIYINDLAYNCKEGIFRIFADDTGIFCHSHDLNSLIVKAKIVLKHIMEWFKLNKLTLNISKTCFIIFRSNRYNSINIPDSITYDNITIFRESQAKYLGLILDEHLNWNAHITDLCNKLKRLFPTFYNIRSYLNEDHIKTLYYSMIHSRINYSCIVYGLTSNENLNKLQILQNKLLKVILKKPYMYPTNALHNELSILQVKDIINQGILTFVHKYLHSELPGVFNDYFQHRHDINDILAGERNLRFLIPPHRTEIGANTMKVKGPKLYNNIINKIKINTSTKVFRKNVKNTFLPYAN